MSPADESGRKGGEGKGDWEGEDVQQCTSRLGTSMKPPSRMKMRLELHPVPPAMHHLQTIRCPFETVGLLPSSWHQS
eukprot:4096285-Amphidinium_carterae.1